jgi:hypothetical protein
MDEVQVFLGEVMLLAAAIAVILGLVMLVLLEARWILGLWVALHRCWRAALRRLRNEVGQDEPEHSRASTSKPVPGPERRM